MTKLNQISNSITHLIDTGQSVPLEAFKCQWKVEILRKWFSLNSNCSGTVARCKDSFHSFDTFFRVGPGAIGVRQNFISYVFRVSTTQLSNHNMAAVGFFFSLLVEFANDVNVFDISNHILRQPQQLCTGSWTLSLFFAIRTSSFAGGLCQNRGHLARGLRHSAARGNKSATFLSLSPLHPSLWVTPFPSKEVGTKANCWKKARVQPWRQFWLSPATLTLAGWELAAL